MSKMINDMVLFGWTVVVMGSLFSVAGVAALWGYDVTLGYFTEEVVSFKGRCTNHRSHQIEEDKGVK